MQRLPDALLKLIARHRRPLSRKPRQLGRFELWCPELEERVTPSHTGGFSHLATAAHAQVASYATGSTLQLTTPTLKQSTLGGTSTSSTSSSRGTNGTGTSTSNSALQSALQTLHNDIQTIELASGTTVGELTAIRAAFQTLSSDGLTPSSYSALRSFEDSLVTTNATTPGSLPGNTTLLNQFIALYTSSSSSLSAQQTADLTTAYNALAAAVTSAGITSANITTINSDWSAVLTAENSTSTATFPYFTLVTGQGYGPGPGFGFGGVCGSG